MLVGLGLPGRAGKQERKGSDVEGPLHVDCIGWSDPPDGVILSRVEILAPSPGCPVYVWAVNDRVEGCPVHWVDGRSRPCIGEKNGCPYQHTIYDPRWYGYLGAWNSKKEEYCLALVTLGCMKQSQAMKENNGSLRGKAVELYRAAKKKRGLVLAKIHPNVFVGELPPPLAVREILLHIWSGNGQHKRKEG